MESCHLGRNVGYFGIMHNGRTILLYNGVQHVTMLDILMLPVLIGYNGYIPSLNESMKYVIMDMIVYNMQDK